MDKEKDAVHAKLRQSAFSEYYSDEPKQSLTYYDWKKTGGYFSSNIFKIISHGFTSSQLRNLDKIVF